MFNISTAEVERCEFWVTANRLVRELGRHNADGLQIRVNNNWNLQQMDKSLEGYNDREIIKYLKYGWPLNANNTALDDTIPNNQLGARQHPMEVNKYLQDELAAGTIIGPFKKNPFGKFARFSPLDTRPKKDSDDLRVILNLSYPHGGSQSTSPSTK